MASTCRAAWMLSCSIPAVEILLKRSEPQVGLKRDQRRFVLGSYATCEEKTFRNARQVIQQLMKSKVDEADKRIFEDLKSKLTEHDMKYVDLDAKGTWRLLETNLKLEKWDHPVQVRFSVNAGSIIVDFDCGPLKASPKALLRLNNVLPFLSFHCERKGMLQWSPALKCRMVVPRIFMGDPVAYAVHSIDHIVFKVLPKATALSGNADEKSIAAIVAQDR